MASLSPQTFEKDYAAEITDKNIGTLNAVIDTMNAMTSCASLPPKVAKLMKQFNYSEADLDDILIASATSLCWA
jgi:hypothetical protein